VKEEDIRSAVWLYIRGCPKQFIAKTLKVEFSELWNTIDDILKGKRPFKPDWGGFDDGDWTLREESILQYMKVQCGRSPADIGKILGRSMQQVKRKWPEMRRAKLDYFDWLTERDKKERRASTNTN
jgi:hypothetical protein